MKKDVLLRQVVKGHVMKDSTIMTHMNWSALHCVIELYLPASVERNAPKTLWQCTAVSCGFLRLGLTGRVISAEIDVHAEARPV